MQTIGLKPWAITADGGFCDYWDYTIKRPNLVKEPPKGRYGTDLLTDEAIQFINKSGDHPFYVYLAYTAPHYPLQAPEEEIAPFKKLGLPEETAIVYGMIARLDKSIGRLLQAVKDRGIEDNTIVVFTSDNGPEFRGEKGGGRARFNGGLAGEKGDVLEGGIKVPTFMSWPARFGSKPAAYEGLVSGVDWQPTLLAAADIKSSGPVDGESILEKILSQKPDSPKRFWSYTKVRPTIFSNGAMRDGEWKLVRPAIPEFNAWNKPAALPLPENKPGYHLFNIIRDPLEKEDLSADQPARLADMIGQYEKWFREVTVSFDDLTDNAAPNSKVTAPGSRK